MKSPVFIVGFLLVYLNISAAHAATFNYTATTRDEVKKSGVVIASGLSWRCRNKSCTITGPWPTPGIGACASLRKEVGEIVSYGHPGRKLSSTQLVQCNKGTATAKSPAAKLSPVRPTSPSKKIFVPGLSAKHKGMKVPAAGASVGAAETPDQILEEWSLGSYMLYVNTPPLTFTGTNSTGPYARNPDYSSRQRPGRSTEGVRWDGNVLRMPGISYQAGSRAALSLPSPGIIGSSASTPTIEIPVSLRNLPNDVKFFTLSCTVNGAGNFFSGAFAAGNDIATTNPNTLEPIRDGAFTGVVRRELAFRPMGQLAEINYAACDIKLKVNRPGGEGADTVNLYSYIDHSSSTGRTDLRPAPDSTPIVENWSFVEK